MAKHGRNRSQSPLVKPHTRGTSNEISLSVLDAAKERQGVKDAEPRKAGTVSLFTLPGRRRKPKGAPSKDESLLYQSDAVRPSRKRARLTWKSKAAPAGKSTGIPSVAQNFVSHIFERLLNPRVGAIILVCVITAALIGAGAVWWRHDAKQQAAHSNSMEQAIATLSQTDADFEALDTLVEDPFGDHPSEEQLIAETRTEVGARLARADELARDASANLRDNREQAVAANVVASVTSRTALWETGLALVDEAAAARAAKQAVEKGWQAVLDGDIHTKTAASLVARDDSDAIEQATDETNAAWQSFERALALFIEAQNGYGTYNASPIIAYIEKRIEACSYALASNQALEDRDKEAAQAANEAYNAADAEAVAMADALPLNPAEEVQKVFTAAVEDKMASYGTARSQAGNADAFIRDYLGAENK